MDRATVYAGQIPREVDILNTGRFGMIGVGMLAAATLGTGTAVAGFTMRPTAPASLIATVSAGQVYQVANIDTTAWSSLTADTRSIVKQGVLLDDFPLTFAPPTTPGYSQSFLVEVQYQDSDTDQKVLPYYNAANPSQGFAGPGGSGAAQNTNRRGLAAIQVKAGVAATAGTQQAPSPDAGWAPLFIVTLSAGQTSVTAGNIVTHPSAPFVPATLMQIPSAVQSGKWQYAVATGVNTLRAALSPPPEALVNGLSVRIACTATNTDAVSLALNGFDPCFVVRKDGTPLRPGDISAGEVVSLVYKDGVFGFVSFVRSEFIGALPTHSLWHYGRALGTPTVLTVSDASPPVSAYTAGVTALVQMPNAFGIGAGAQIQFGSLASVPVLRNDGTPIQAGDAPAGSPMLIAYDGTTASFRLVGFGRNEVPRIAVNPILYVRPDGNDNNDGTANDAAHAFQSIAAALSYGVSRFSIAGTSLTIQLGAAGTYTAPNTIPNAVGTLQIRGDENNPAAYVLSGSGAGSAAPVVASGGRLNVIGLTIQNTGATAHTFAATNNAVCLLQNVTLTCTASGNTGYAHVFAVGGANVTIGQGCAASGSMAALYQASGGIVSQNSTTLTLQGTPNFATATAFAVSGGQIIALSGASIAGGATGVRYQAAFNGIISVFGAGINFFPGNAPGTTQTGGQYAP